MLDKCAKAVRAAAKEMGREGLKDSDLRAIDDRMQSTMRRLARTEPEWRGLSMDQRVSLAAEKIMAEIQHDAQRSADLKVKQLMVQARATAEVQGLKDAAGIGESQAVGRHYIGTDLYRRSLARDAQGELMDTIKAAGDKTGAGIGRRFLMAVFDVENPVMTRDMLREVFKGADGHTGNRAATAGARAWLDTIEGLRTRFNAAGGDVGALDYGYVPQPHDGAKVRKAGADPWAQKVLPLLDRSRYMDERGAQLSDGEMMDFLRQAHETIATDGLNKSEPGEFKGTGKRANRGSDSREIHFKDGDAWASYMAEFGRGSLYDAMMRHVSGITRDIALVERYGPGAADTARLLQDMAVRADGKQPGAPVGAWMVNPQTYWNMISGKVGAPADEGIANAFQTVRNVMTAAKLGGALISSFADLGTLAVTAGYNRLPYWQLLKDIARQGTAESREFMAVHGMAADSAMNALNRWSGENVGNNWSGHLSNTVMRLSLLNAWTDGLKQGFTLSMNAKMAELTRLPWAQVSQFDRVRFERSGITEADWAVLNMVQIETFKGRQLLTPQAIKGLTVSQFEAARPSELQSVRDRIAAQTSELSARNAQERQWIGGRLDKFDQARDALNRQVKANHAKRMDKNEQATGPMLERMALLDAQREQAQMHADMEADFNRFSTQNDVRSFLNAVEDGASADKTDVQQAKPAVRAGLDSAETIGRRYGVSKGRLERRMIEIENRINEMDRETGRTTNADAKAAQKKAEAMGTDLQEFIKNSQERQARRQHVIDRLHAEEAPRIDAEATRVKNMIAAKFMGFIDDEADHAIVSPDMATRAITTMGGQQAGTYGGELARTVTQFKAFPISMFTRHWSRMLEGDMGADGAPLLANRATYGFAMMATLLGLGALSFQTKQVLNGKDPISMDPTTGTGARFWARAMATGGGLGIAGDMLLVDPQGGAGDATATFIKTLAGPAIGTAGELLTKNIVENAWQAAEGKDTHWQAELLNWAKGNTPGASLWWVKPFMEHGFLNAINENLSPGYLSRVQDKARKDWGQRYWWAPRDLTPQRAPDMEKALGQ